MEQNDRTSSDAARWPGTASTSGRDEGHAEPQRGGEGSSDRMRTAKRYVLDHPLASVVIAAGAGFALAAARASRAERLVTVAMTRKDDAHRQTGARSEVMLASGSAEPGEP